MKRSHGGWEPYPDGKFTAEGDQIQFDGNCVFDSSFYMPSETMGEIRQDHPAGHHPTFIHCLQALCSRYLGKSDSGEASENRTEANIEKIPAVRLITQRDLAASEDGEKEREQGK